MRKISYLLILIIIICLSIFIAFTKSVEKVNDPVEQPLQVEEEKNEEKTEKIKVKYDDKQFELDALLTLAEGQFLVPYKELFKKVGVNTDFDEVKNVIIAETNGIKLEIPIGENYIFRNGEELEIISKSIVKDDKTYVPIIDVMKVFECEVSWNGDLKIVEINRYSPIEIHVVASKEDMLKGQFRVEHWEWINGNEIREFNLAWEIPKSKDWLDMYVIDDKGTFEYKYNEGRATYNLVGNNEIVKYGYIINPIQDDINSGFCIENFAIFASRNLVDLDFISKNKNHDVKIVFDIPDEFTLISAWEKISESEEKYLVRTRFTESNYIDEIGKGGIAVWGKFDSMYESQYQDNKLILFSYNEEDIDYNVEDMAKYTIESYQEMMTAFKGLTPQYFPPITIGGFVPDDLLYNLYDVWNFEGYRGAYIQELSTKYLNEKPYAWGAEHGFCHWLIDDGFLESWWTIEGLAEFTTVYVPEKLGYSNDSNLKRLMEDIKFYKEEILANNIDIPIALKNKRDLADYESIYPIKITNSGYEATYNYLSPQDDYEWKYGSKYQNNRGILWFVYRKSLMVYYILNDIIITGTNGEQDIFDLLNVWYKNSPQINLDADGRTYQFTWVEKEIYKMTGINISGFFKRYVISNVPLPIDVVDGEIVVTIPEPEYEYKDKDKDDTSLVEFKDSALEAVIRKIIGKAEGNILYSDVKEITNLEADNKGIRNLEGIEHLDNLRNIQLMGNEITDLTSIKNLVNLNSLMLDNNDLSNADLSPITELKNLTHLYLNETKMKDISILKDLDSLLSLHLQWNKITDVTPLSSLTDLEELFLGGNPITDYSPLDTLTNTIVNY